MKGIAAGIGFDVGKAMEDYAKALGCRTDELTYVQKQQAILNAVLEKEHIEKERENEN